MYVHEESPDSHEGFGWWIKTAVVPEGHEVLTRAAARGLPIPVADLTALIEGVRRPDQTVTGHVRPGEQRRHFLRALYTDSSRKAYRAAIGHLRGLHRRILGSGSNRQEQFRLIGEALHLIQDSFAPAHVRRDRRQRIRYIRNFGPSNLATRTPEHGFPVDARDRIHRGVIRPTLRSEARRAISASRDYLRMTLRHIGGGVPPSSISRDLNAFIARHLRM